VGEALEAGTAAMDDAGSWGAPASRVPVDGTGGALVEGTIGAEGAEVDMNADTRLLALALLRLY
jgi:hypothetical protein